MIVLLVIDAADQGESMHLAGAIRQKFADVGAGDGRRNRLEWTAGVGPRLGVPGFELAKAAGHENDQDPFLLPLDLARGAYHVAKAEQAEPGGRTMMSAPVPFCRALLSSRMPSASPTISRIKVTSTATAVMLMIDRSGRLVRLATIILFMGIKLVLSSCLDY